MPNPLDPLDDLRPAAREWADAVLHEHDLSTTGRVLVIEAARALETIEEARSARADLVEDGRYEGTAKIAPLLVIERQARADFLNVLRQLDIDGG